MLLIDGVVSDTCRFNPSTVDRERQRAAKTEADSRRLDFQAVIFMYGISATADD